MNVKSFFQLMERSTVRKCIHSAVMPVLNRSTGEELWICKPTSANQGKGIFLVRDFQQVLARLEQDQMSCRPASKPVARIVQRYIMCK